MTELRAPSDRPSAWAVCLLGRTAVRDVQGRWRPLERKAAALLALLALDGPMSRSRLVAFLWPDTREVAARNNLVHLLRKLHQLSGTALIEGRETLSLAPGMHIDVQDLFAAGMGTFASRYTVPDASFLGTHSFDDCPDLEEWIAVERERLEEWCLLALREQARTLEEAGAYDAALACVLRLLDLDPFSEDAHHRLIRLHALSGNRHRALRAFDRLCDLLKRELNAEPLRATLDLVSAIRQVGIPAQGAPSVLYGVPA